MLSSKAIIKRKALEDVGFIPTTYKDGLRFSKSIHGGLGPPEKNGARKPFWNFNPNNWAIILEQGI